MSHDPDPSPLKNPLTENPVNVLRQASLITLTALSDAFGKFGLRVIDGATLRLIGANPGCNQGEVGRALGVQRTNMVPIVAALVDAGQVERRVADGRTHALHLTRKGKTLLAKIEAAGEAVEARFFGGLDAKARADFEAALRAISAS